MYHSGDLVIYRVSKRNRRPAKNASKIYPAPKGEEYLYEIDKFWAVSEVREDGQILVTTRRGKERLIAADDPDLRRAKWWERILYKHRFPHPKYRFPQPKSGRP